MKANEKGFLPRRLLLGAALAWVCSIGPVFADDENSASRLPQEARVL
jgi:hypothetical protein